MRYLVDGITKQVIMKQNISLVIIFAFLLMILFIFPIKKLKVIFFNSKSYKPSKEEYIPKKTSSKKYFYTLIEIMICIGILYGVNPFVEFLYVEKYAKLKAIRPGIFELDYFYSPERRMGDKILLYGLFTVLIICYYAFKYTISTVSKANVSIQTLSNIIRIRLLIIAFVFIASFLTLLPLDLPDWILALCIVSSFIPLIIIITNISMIGINNERNAQKALLQSVTIFITSPIFFYGLFLVSKSLHPFLGRWTLIILSIPFYIIFLMFLIRFSSFRNLDNDAKEMDKYFK